MLYHINSVFAFFVFVISFYQTCLLLKVFVMDHKDAYEGQEVEKEVEGAAAEKHSGKKASKEGEEERK